MLQLETYMWINNYMYYHSPPGRNGKLPEGVGQAGKSHDLASTPRDWAQVPVKVSSRRTQQICSD